MEQPKEDEPQKVHPDTNSLSGAVKPRYMQEIDQWFDEVIVHGDQEDEESYFKRLRNAIKAKLIESFRSGERKAEGFRFRFLPRLFPSAAFSYL